MLVCGGLTRMQPFWSRDTQYHQFPEPCLDASHASERLVSVVAVIRRLVGADGRALAVLTTTAAARTSMTASEILRTDNFPSHPPVMAMSDGDTEAAKNRFLHQSL
jgi:hypothetical protein